MSVESAEQRLIKLAADKTMAHAYLIEGARGSGKGELALRIAQAVLCPTPKDGEPCGICQICTQVAAGAFPDLFRFSNELESVPAAEVRRLREWLYQSPLSGARKVAVIDEISRLSPLSQNTLLKVVEEPPSGTVILITDSSRAAIDTIRSRAQRVWLGGAATSEEAGEWLSLIAELPDLAIPKLFSTIEEIAVLSQPEVKTLVEGWISQLREGLLDEEAQHDSERKIRRLLTLYQTLNTNAAMRLQLEAALLELKLIAN